MNKQMLSFIKMYNKCNKWKNITKKKQSWLKKLNKSCSFRLRVVLHNLNQSGQTECLLWWICSNKFLCSQLSQECILGM